MKGYFILGESLVDLKPGSVKAEAERSSVGLVMTVKVMSEQSGKLTFIVDVGTRGHQVTS